MTTIPERYRETDVDGRTDNLPWQYRALVVASVGKNDIGEHLHLLWAITVQLITGIGYL